jgi:hypothetical protein
MDGVLREKTVSLCPVVVHSALCPFRPDGRAPKELTIEAIFAEGGLTGRAPETIKWSPDGTKVSFVQRDDSGDHGELWYVDTTTGEKKVLVSEIKLASSPPLNKIKDEREKERVTRYHVAAYIWSPDSSTCSSTPRDNSGISTSAPGPVCAAYRFLRSKR